MTEASTGTAAAASVSGSPYAIVPSTATGGTFSAGNYNITYGNGSLTVTPAALTVTASNASKVYGQTPALTAFTSSGLQNGETIGSVTEASTGTAAIASVSGSPYAIVPSTATGGTFSAGNYNITYGNGSLTVTPAALTVTGLSGTNRTYNGTTVDALTGTAVLSGLQNGETLILGNTANGALASANAGIEPVSTAVTISNGTGLASNYTLTQAALANVAIAQAPLTVTASNASKVYGQTPALMAFTSSGLQNGETIGSVTEASTGTAATASVSGSPYAIVPSTATGGTFSAGNYNITYGNGSLTVTPAALTVTASNASKVYGQTPALTAFTSGGLQNGETIGSVTEASTGTAATASVSGSPYAIVPSTATGGTFSAGNYNITYGNGSLTVTPAALTVTASNASKTFGSANPTLGVSYSGFVNGDTSFSLTEQATASTVATASSNAGSYPITVSGAVYPNSNYAISYVNGTLTIVPLVLTGGSYVFPTFTAPSTLPGATTVQIASS